MLLIPKSAYGVPLTQQCGLVFDRRPGQRVKADRHVIRQAEENQNVSELTEKTEFSR
jgi:hypothetical protein